MLFGQLSIAVLTSTQVKSTLKKESFVQVCGFGGFQGQPVLLLWACGSTLHHKGSGVQWRRLAHLVAARMQRERGGQGRNIPC